MKTKSFLTLIASALLAFGIATATSAAEKVKPYSKKTCAVTDNKLGSMGTPVTKIYDGQEVKFCCKPCVSKFEKNPSKYLATGKSASSKTSSGK